VDTTEYFTLRAKLVGHKAGICLDNSIYSHWSISSFSWIFS